MTKAIRTSAWCLSFVVFLGLISSYSYAAVKVFSAGGDATSWDDADNWFETGVPAKTDEVYVDLSGATAIATKDFTAQSITVGGKATSQFTANNFVFGLVTPSSVTDPALLLRKGGTIELKGAGTITVKGSFKNTEESLTPEPSVMVLLG